MLRRVQPSRATISPSTLVGFQDLMFSETLSLFSQSGKFSPHCLLPFGKFSFGYGKRNTGAEWKLLLSEIKVNSNEPFLTLWEASNYVSRHFNHNMRCLCFGPCWLSWQHTPRPSVLRNLLRSLLLSSSSISSAIRPPSTPSRERFPQPRCL